MTGVTAQFWALYGASLVGAAALTPYVLRLVKTSTKARKTPPALMMAAGFVQNAVLFALVVWGGLWCARAIGLHAAPYVSALLAGKPLGETARSVFVFAAEWGGAAGLFLLTADLFLLPRLPAFLELTRRSTLLENFLASFYGGINEELLTRLLGVSGLAWLFTAPWTGAHARPQDWQLWLAIAVMAVLFALGHLPASRAVAGRLNRLIVIRSLALNGPVAVLCGWLYWRYGIEAAIIAHFTVDIVYHLFGTALLRANDRLGFMGWIPAPAPAAARP